MHIGLANRADRARANHTAYRRPACGFRALIRIELMTSQRVFGGIGTHALKAALLRLGASAQQHNKD